MVTAGVVAIGSLPTAHPATDAFPVNPWIRPRDELPARRRQRIADHLESHFLFDAPQPAPPAIRSRLVA
jgi:hypothetical protein